MPLCYFLNFKQSTNLVFLKTAAFFCDFIDHISSLFPNLALQIQQVSGHLGAQHIVLVDQSQTISSDLWWFSAAFKIDK